MCTEKIEPKDLEHLSFSSFSSSSGHITHIARVLYLRVTAEKEEMWKRKWLITYISSFLVPHLKDSVDKPIANNLLWVLSSHNRLHDSSATCRFILKASIHMSCCEDIDSFSSVVSS